MPKAKGFRLPKDVDGYSERGARMIAEAIKAHWKRLGYAVAVERFKIRGQSWGIKSNLVNGMPPGSVA